MKSIYVSPYTNHSLDSLKIAALYCDKIELKQRMLLRFEMEKHDRKRGKGQGRFIEMIPIIDDDFISDIKLLLDEGIIKVIEEDTEDEYEKVEGLFKQLMEKDDIDIQLFQPEYSKSSVELRILDPFIIEIFERYFGPMYKGMFFSTEFFYTYFEGLIIDIINYLMKGENIIGASPSLTNFIHDLYSHPQITKSGLLSNTITKDSMPHFACDVIETSLLDVSQLTFHDILEARIKLNDELLAFQEEMEQIKFELLQEFSYDKIIREGKSIARARLSPRILSIERKIKSGRISLLKKLLTIMKKPGAYVPFLGSLLSGLPIHLSLLVSLGLVSGEVALEYWLEQRELRQEGLFYLVKLKQKFKKLNKLSLSKSDEFKDKRKSKRNKLSEVDFFIWPSQITQFKKINSNK